MYIPRRDARVGLKKTRDPEAIKRIVWLPDHRIKTLSMENGNIGQVNNNSTKSNFYTVMVFSTLKICLPQVAKVG